jgi:hypothetical protein
MVTKMKIDDDVTMIATTINLSLRRRPAVSNASALRRRHRSPITDYWSPPPAAPRRVARQRQISRR